jgi:hypothetical protein
MAWHSRVSLFGSPSLSTSSFLPESFGSRRLFQLFRRRALTRGSISSRILYLEYSLRSGEHGRTQSIESTGSRCTALPV